MPKPFWIQKSRRNFLGSGKRASGHQVQFDRRVDWTSRIPKPPPPPGPEYVIEGDWGRVVCTGGDVLIDHSAIAIIAGAPGAMQLHGASGKTVADQAVIGSLQFVKMVVFPWPIQGGVIPPWTPNPDKDLLLWYDAQDLATLTPTPVPPAISTINLWENKSIWTNDMGGSFNDPDWRPTSINNLPSVYIDSASELMATILLQAGSSGAWNMLGGLTIFAVVSNAASGEVFRTISGDSIYNISLELFYDSDKFVKLSVGDSAFQHPDPLPGGPLIIVGRFSLNPPNFNTASIDVGFLSVPGVLDMEGSSSLGAGAATPQVFGYLGATNPDNMGIGELLVYDRAMSSSEIEDAVGYLVRKWDF